MNQPNILWICTDQQRYDTLGCYYNPFVRTPNIDALASSGTLFETAFCQNPLCTPSRASFLTGRYPRTTRARQNGQSIPESEVLVTKLLASSGYTCGLAGKLHLSAAHPTVAAVMERRIDDGYTEFNWSHHPDRDWPTADYNVWLDAQGAKFKRTPVAGSKFVQNSMPEPLHQTTWCADRAIDYIHRRQISGQPWLFSVNIYDPHHPFDPPAQYLDRYLQQLADIPLPNYVEGELDNKPVFQRIDHSGAYGGIPNFYPSDKMTDSEQRFVRAAYWAMVDLIDVEVGRILRALEESGQSENTIVIFMSDHGELLGDHGIYLKGPFFYEPAVRVPLIISWPGRIAAGVRSEALVELVDIAPTLLEATGNTRYPGMQGRSLWPLLTQRSVDGVEQHRESIYCEHYGTTYPEPGRNSAFATMLRTREHKLVVMHGLDDGELYDLAAEPLESRNLWSEREHQNLKLEMLQALTDRMAWTVDPLPLRDAKW